MAPCVEVDRIFRVFDLAALPDAVSSLAPPRLGEVVVLQVDLGPVLASTGTLVRLQRLSGGLLTAAELQHAGRYRLEADAVRHLVGRALLRALARHACPNSGGELVTGKYGKPLIAWPGWDCNLSHSGAALAFAIGHGVAVGIDVEGRAGLQDWPSLIADFHPAEQAAMQALRPRVAGARRGSGLADRRGVQGEEADDEDNEEAADLARAAFARLWTRKESVCKALGTGFSLPLTAYRVAVTPAPSGWLLQAPRGLPLSQWSCLDLAGDDACSAALSCLGRLEALHISSARLLA